MVGFWGVYWCLNIGMSMMTSGSTSHFVGGPLSRILSGLHSTEHCPSAFSVKTKAERSKGCLWTEQYLQNTECFSQLYIIQGNFSNHSFLKRMSLMSLVFTLFFVKISSVHYSFRQTVQISNQVLQWSVLCQQHGAIWPNWRVLLLLSPREICIAVISFFK